VPQTLQHNIDEVVTENEDLYNTVSMIKKRANDGAIDGTKLKSVERSYNAMGKAYDDWRTQLQRIINNDIDNYDADVPYQNTVTRLNIQRDDFKLMANSALGVKTTLVPAWPDEAIAIITFAHKEGNMKEAADAVHDELALKPWAEIQ